MAERKAQAVWTGKLKEGHGKIRVESGAFEGSYSAASRFEQGSGTNPEELIAAAHAGCYSMALAHLLAGAGFEPGHIATEATVRLEKEGDGFAIPSIALRTEAKVPGIEENAFQEQAEKAKTGCPVSKALAGPKITLEATLLAEE